MESGTSIYHYRTKDQQFAQFFKQEEDLVYSKMLTLGKKNILQNTLVKPKKIFLSLLHIKLGLKIFVRALPKDSDCFKYLCRKFPHLSEAILKEGIFVESDIRKMMFDSSFEVLMSTKEKEACISFKEVLTKFLGNMKASNYELIVANMIDNFKTFGCLVVRFLQTILTFFLKTWVM